MDLAIFRAVKSSGAPFTAHSNSLVAPSPSRACLLYTSGESVFHWYACELTLGVVPEAVKIRLPCERGKVCPKFLQRHVVWPVSYTHLDVYKRQSLKMSLLASLLVKGEDEFCMEYLTGFRAAFQD